MKKVKISAVFNLDEVVLKDAAQQLRENLAAHLSTITEKSAGSIFINYVSAIHPHFIAWVSAMQNSCVTPLGKYAAADNLCLELSENHQQMLLDFMQQMLIQPHAAVYRGYLLEKIIPINKVMAAGVEHHNGIGASAVIYLLEETSKAFIPWIEEMAIKKGAQNLEYTQKHGAADEKHASLALDAFAAECALGTNEHDKYVQYAIEGVEGLLEVIFDPK